MAVAFMLAHPYGKPRVMSSFAFNDPSQGPPADSNGAIIAPNITSEGTCTNGWVCEHRWPQISNMVAFRNIVGNSSLENWWTGDKDQIAFSRGNLAFIAFNAGSNHLKQKLSTGLPPGKYCDVISGEVKLDRCTGKTIVVGSDGKAQIDIPRKAEDGMIAIHTKVRI